MKIIAVEKEMSNARTIDFRKNAKAEAKALWHLYLKGVVREVYFKADENLAILILETKNKQSANRELNKLPFVNKKLIKFDLIPLKPYPGFQRLFK